MSLPFSDTFTNTNGTPLNTHNAGWTIAQNGFTIENNRATATANDDCRAYWTGDTFNPNQYAKTIVNGAASGSQYRGVVGRATGTDGTYSAYEVYTDSASGSGHTEIAKVTLGALVALKAVATTFADGDEIEIRVSGTTTTTIQMWKNGVLIDSVTDSVTPFLSGSAGPYAYGFSGGLDSIEVGNLATSTATLTGVAGTGSAGTLSAAATSASKTLTGNSATGQVGTLSASTGGSASTNLTGVSATGSPGSLTGVAVNMTLGGVHGTGQAGSLMAWATAMNITLTGNTATGSAGTLSASSIANPTVSLASVSATGSAGTISAIPNTATITLPGVTAMGAVGRFTTTPAVPNSYPGVSGSSVSSASVSARRSGVGYAGVAE